jgi:lysozyme
VTPTDFEMMLIRHEGMELKPYTCTAGKLTIGVGRNIEDMGITEDEAIYMLRNDVAKYAAELASAKPVVKALDDVRYYVLLNMAFNLGISRLLKFEKMWQAIEDNRFVDAALEMQDSRWCDQVKGRCKELAELMENG